MNNQHIDKNKGSNAGDSKSDEGKSGGEQKTDGKKKRSFRRRRGRRGGLGRKAEGDKKQEQSGETKNKSNQQKPERDKSIGDGRP